MIEDGWRENMTEKELKEAVKKHGFMANIEPGTILVVPAGYILACAYQDSQKAVVIVRWGLMSKADVPQVAKSLQTLLQSHKFLAGTDYETLANVLDPADGS